MTPPARIVRPALRFGGCDDTAGRQLLTPLEQRVLDAWRGTLTERALPFSTHLSVLPPDSTTLFATSGMQKHKPRFSDPSSSGLILGDVQRCLRLTDLDELDDGRHGLVFHMLGLFAFNSGTVPFGIDVVQSFFRRLGVPLTHATVHPDRWDEWRPFHEPYGLAVHPDPDCKWSDGAVEGYCTEFYAGGLEVGNVVNPLGTGLDIGLGLERVALALGAPPRTPETHLENALHVLEDDGVVPGPRQQGYVARRLVRELRRRGSTSPHPWLQQERDRFEAQRHRYDRLRSRFGDRPASWWWDTHGVDLSEMVEEGPPPSLPPRPNAVS